MIFVEKCSMSTYERGFESIKAIKSESQVFVYQYFCGQHLRTQDFKIQTRCGRILSNSSRVNPGEKSSSYTRGIPDIHYYNVVVRFW